MSAYETLGYFYLGRRYDPATGAATPDPVLYDARDLTTHAVCVGMTGSGKTGLGIVLLEEAAIDGIPAIVIDPKGDMGNLLLTFPALRPEDFEPWIEPDDAARKGLSVPELAAQTAQRWRDGLAEWDQPPERIAKLRQAAEFCLYTPGSQSGRPLALLRNLTAPPPALLDDPDALRERIQSAVSGLLALLGVNSDPMTGREHILLSGILAHAWAGKGALDLAGLIGAVQEPPMRTVGVLDIDTFFPPRDRYDLSLRLNALLASPGFAAWMEGEPLDIARLLHAPDGRPRVSVLSIAHLSDAERMFFVTLLLNEMVAWMRAQPGTSSLRAVLYMDEIFGFFPPTANPPSKLPMLTLLKQARAHGLGVVLATQNPVDLDYKGLANAGTWCIGRLQTERDKARVLDGLEGAAAAAGQPTDRASLDRTLSGLGNRVFLLHNVHEAEPILLQTRWCLSYLRGPLARAQLRALASPASSPAASAAGSPPAAAGSAVAPLAPPAGMVEATPSADTGRRPVLPPKVKEYFLPVRARLPGGSRLLYRPALLATGRAHYTQVAAKVDLWVDIRLVVGLAGDTQDTPPWDEADALAADIALDREAAPQAQFGHLPAGVAAGLGSGAWEKAFAAEIYQNRPLRLLKCPALRAVSTPGETEGDFRARLLHVLHEQRDAEKTAIERKITDRLGALQERIRRAEQKIAVEKAQYGQQKLQTVVAMGSTLLGALFGRKLGSAGNVTRAATTVRSAGRVARERGDVARASETVEALRAKAVELEAELEAQLQDLARRHDPAGLALEELVVRPRKSDTSVGSFGLAWLPWSVDRDGIAAPAWM